MLHIPPFASFLFHSFFPQMFLFSLLFVASTLLYEFTGAHTSMAFPPSRGHPLNPNAAAKDFACITAPLNGGAGCPRKAYPCGGYKADLKIDTVLKAGSVINVIFYNPNFPGGPKELDTEKDQARHTGGLCEFSLSYDGGVSFQVIATYHKSCPDIFYGWPVKIPASAPASDNCIFAWSWINASGNREFYMNCADVRIESEVVLTAGASFKMEREITKANLPGVPGFEAILTPEGNTPIATNGKGTGPSVADIMANLGQQSVNSKPETPSLPVVTVTVAAPTANPAIATPVPGTCARDGEFACVSASAFTICDHGRPILMDCPAGTKCLNGRCI